MHRTIVAFAAVAMMLAAPRPAAAGPAEPSGPHPRILLDAALRATWKKQVGVKGSAVHIAVQRCDQVRASPKEFARDLYMGLDWAQNLQACLVAWAASGKAEHAKLAMTYFTAMLDDLETIGDKKGGDQAARRDSGFAIRAMGPYTALAYDWLHDDPAMTEPLRARARQRFAAWTDWYLANGYRARSPGTNYQAGYLMAATLIAVAQGGEGGEASAKLWRLVADELWGKDMVKALQPGGVLDGGDWGEGWQYGPLSVAEYAVASRVIHAAGVDVPGIDRWLTAVFVRFVHALTPGNRMFAGGDTQAETANLDPNLLVPGAVVIGDGPPELQRQAIGELRRLKLKPAEFPLFAALVDGRGLEPQPVPRAQWPTFYRARGIGTVYARSDWSDRAVWMALQCTRTVDVDHIHPNAGNLVLSRGADDVIVDPSPYGTLSSLTSNAPTVESAQLPPDYKPSQAYWSEKTGYTWAQQTASGLVTARCDYADQYKFQDRPSDVAMAQRDVVLWPHGGDASLIVIDRASSGEPARGLFVRFRTLATLALDGEVARGTVGGTILAIRRLASAGAPQVRRLAKGDCFKGDFTRGNCETPRIDVGEYRVKEAGPTMSTWHLIEASGKGGADGADKLSGAGYQGVHVGRGGHDLVVVDLGGRAAKVPVPAGASVVVVDPPAEGDHTSITGAAGGKGCELSIAKSGGTSVPALPAVVTVGKDCAIAVDPAVDSTPGEPAALRAATSGGGQEPGSGSAFGSPRSARSGCCGAQSAPEPSAVFGFVVVALVLGRRRWGAAGRRARD